ncbi:Cysteine-rich RLK (RECEPTOR-like protein kinase) 8 [Theobroma cacao]|uniref:Cysteine-rich RLK (RECEPTOR-like protein kinase) 8 n=1 Tax=Theobroma cacao TaxID=3641 RepID=A0A061EJ32_THECC|nr:Cysteine-rich RLK (RECEPTOR-like protein kinase) 8 [Theobroma cacao]
MAKNEANQVNVTLVSSANASHNIAIDTKSPYFLHSSDHPGLIFVTHPLNENGENYFTWRRSFLNALRSKNKAGFVDGTIVKPDVNSQDYDSWVQCNAIVLFWLINALAKEIQSSAAHADTTHEVWADLQERFTQRMAPRMYELRRAIALLQQEKSSISSYYGKLKTVWGELQASNPIPVCTCGCTCGAAKKMEDMQEQEKVFDFLMGLDDTFSTVRSQILSVDPLPSLGKTSSIAAQEEKQRQVAVNRVPTVEGAAFLAGQDLSSRRPIRVGRVRDGLYYLEPIREGKALMASNMRHADMWHRRLGHLPMNRLSFIGDLSINVKENKFCDACCRARQHRLPFFASTYESSRIFELIHCDIWGDYKTPSLSGAVYFLTIVNDYSRAIWVYLMKHKSKTRDYLLHFYQWVRTQFNTQVKIVRSDNRMEFKHSDLLTYYNENGIERQTSCTNTPQQNGRVERNHRHLLEVARVLRFQAYLPIKFWGECVLTAAYLINRMPLSVLKNKTPYEILFGRSPTYQHLRTFGCLCYGLITNKSRDKFTPCSKPGIFLGYPHGQKGYRIFDIEDKKIYTSRDVQFFKNIFPSALTKGSNEIDGSPITHILASWTSTNPNIQVHTYDESFMCSYLNPFDKLAQGSSMIESHGDSAGHLETEPCESYDTARSGELNDTGTLDEIGQHHSLSNEECTIDANGSLRQQIEQPSTAPAAILSTDEPTNFHQAIKHTHWRDAMAKEISTLEENKTWVLSKLPLGKPAINSKWVYKIKYNPDGSVERYKARLVAKGYTQIEGVDFHETFAPVAKLVTVRCLLAVASVQNWELHQLDVNNAFLHGDLNEEVYMKIPQGFTRKREQRVYHSLFLFHRGPAFIAVLIYVDDVIITGNDLDRIIKLKRYLDKKFRIKDLGKLKYFLGIEVARSPSGIVLSQHKYVLDILSKCGLMGSKPSSFPIDQQHKLASDTGPLCSNPELYRRLVGRLLYLTITRPDISYVVHLLSQFMHNPRQLHLNAVFCVLRYLKNAPGQGLLLPSNNSLSLRAYCDADWAGCPTTRRSTTDYIIFLGSSPISWRSKKQTVVSRSSTEAEYRAMATISNEIIWLIQLLRDLQVPCSNLVPLFCDNQAAIHIAANPVFHEPKSIGGSKVLSSSSKV